MRKHLARVVLGSLLALLALLPAPRARATTYATWLMVWNGHTEGWWKPGDYEGARVYVRGRWQSVDWADDAQINEYLDNVKRAGITVVVADLTNGWGWLDARCRYIQSLCARKGLKFCVAENSTGDVARFDGHAHDIWTTFAGPDAPYRQTYFRYHGRPLIVCYAIRDWYRAYRRSDGPWRRRFHLVWASGEDSERDKWGWQLEPWVGSLPSRDSMFVTSSLKWANADPLWRKSLAWLDYNFALARRQRPAFVIVGSYDDLSERNSWLVADTTRCVPGRQMRATSGAISATAYYERVREWIADAPAVVPGGPLPDGAYRVLTGREHRALAVRNTDSHPHAGTDAAVGAPLVVGADPGPGLNGVFWLYHLGRGVYRIIALHSGLALEAPADAGVPVRQTWDSADAHQRWVLDPGGDGGYRLKNTATGLFLDVAGAAVVSQPKRASPGQEWRLQHVLGP